MPTTLKLYFALPGADGKQEVRRVTMEDPLTLTAIRSFLASKYSIDSTSELPPFRIEYEDEDGDRIVVSGQLELEEGLRHHAAVGGAAPWKLFCAFDDELSPSPSPSPRAVNQSVEEPLLAGGSEVDSAVAPKKDQQPTAAVKVEDALSEHASDDEYERVEADASTDEEEEQPATCATPTRAMDVVDEEPNSLTKPATPSLMSADQADDQEDSTPTETAPVVEALKEELKPEPQAKQTSVAELADTTAALRLAPTPASVEVTPVAESAALAEARLESLIDQRAVDRFACRLCTKVFLARHFVVRHLNTKHREVIAQELETTEETPAETAMPESQLQSKSEVKQSAPQLLQASPTSQAMTVAPEKAVVPVASPSPLVEESSPKSSPASVEIADVTGHPEHVEPSPEPVEVASTKMAETPNVSVSSNSSASSSVTHEGVTCDSCGVSPIVGIRWRCVQCTVPGGFDLCQACESAGDRHDPSHVLMKLRQPAYVPVGTTHAQPRHQHCPAQQHGRMHSTSAGRRPRALFVSDVTLADGLAVSAGETLTKIWSIKNVGESAWPAGTRIVFVGGDLAPESENRTDPYGAVVPFAGPGDVVHISLAIQVPNATGRFRGTFRLETPDRQRFGPRIWIDLVVPEEQQQAQEQGPVESVDEKKPIVAEEPKQSAAPIVESKATVEEPVQPQDEEAEFAAACAASLATPQPSVSVSTPSVASPVPQASFAYSNQLAQLRSMGFTADAELYRYLLLNTKGDVQAVVAWLLNNAK